MNTDTNGHAKPKKPTKNGGKTVYPPAGNWARPPTGAQFSHIPIGERATATPLLLHRLKQYGLALPKGRPVYDRIYVYPLESKDQDDKIEGSVLYKPTSVKNKLGASRGVLVKAGLGALEQLWSHGIELGHIVLVARLSPWERRFERQGREHTVLVLRSSEVVASEDLEDDVLEECITFKYQNGSLCFEDRVRADPAENDEGS